MPLVNMRPLLAGARKGGYAVAAFSVANMETILGVVSAAERANAPIILQLAEARMQGSPLYLMAPMMLAAARAARVPVAVHLDHGLTLETVRAALEAGFTSVMIDGSTRPLAENIALTNQAIALAQKAGAAVEAEIGRVGKTEDGKPLAAATAKLEECLEFLERAPADALAVAIGNAHGLYPAAPKLDFALLEALRERTSIPLVFHGGSGIGEADFRRLISLGMVKINIATDTFIHAASAYELSHANLYDKMACVRAAAEAVATRHIAFFGSAGKGAIA